MVVSGLHEQTRADALDVHRILAFMPSGLSTGRHVDLQDAHIHLGFEHRQRLAREARRNQHLHKLLGNLLRCSAV